MTVATVAMTLFVALLTGAPATADDCVPFRWQAVRVGDLDVVEGAIIVSVDIPSIGSKLPLQLDTGSKATILYRRSGLKMPEGESVQTAAGITGWQPKSISVELDTKVDVSADDKSAPVGTAGTNLFPNGFVIDFPARSICPLTARARASFAQWDSYEPVNGSPVIRAQEKNRPLKLLLDTGSGAFTLLSTPHLSETIRGAEEGRLIHVPSFGRSLAVRELTPKGTVIAFGRPLRMPNVYSFDDADIEGLLKSAGLNGLIGLRPFDHGRLGFDFANRKLAFEGRDLN